jgi:hypothetical protein
LDEALADGKPLGLDKAAGVGSDLVELILKDWGHAGSYSTATAASVHLR